MDEDHTEEEDHERDDDHLLALNPSHVDHLCHHLLQTDLLRGRFDGEPDEHVGHDDHLHQCDGETAHHLLLEDGRLLADLLPAGSLH